MITNKVVQDTWKCRGVWYSKVYVLGNNSETLEDGNIGYKGSRNEIFARTRAQGEAYRLSQKYKLPIVDFYSEVEKLKNEH